MENPLFALLIHDRPHPFEALKEALKALAVRTFSVRTCEELDRLISQTQPHLIFSDTSFTDGTWMDVVRSAEEAPVPVNVILVGANDNMKLYVSALERGAFDFILPPFERQGLEFVVTSAARDASRRRQFQALVGAA